jgi:subtilisin family serine protease
MMFVVFRETVMKDSKPSLSLLSKACGYKELVASADFGTSGVAMEKLDAADGLFLNKLGIALVKADDDRIHSLMSASAKPDNDILSVEPEYVMEAINQPTVSLDYIRGYRDSINHLYEQLLAGHASAQASAAATTFADNNQFTWGLQSTGVHTSSFDGTGINVAILDTGLDFAHVDFVGRPVVSASFIPGETAQDANSHGTHCTGTACGPKNPASGVRRYGCATNANIFIAKVLANDGFSRAGSVTSGMDWAITNKCQVLSMSLSASVDAASVAYETLGRRALDQGSLIIAAAGNNANRQFNNFGFVGQPANATSILAVGGIDRFLAMYNRSARSSTNTDLGGKIDLVGPAVDVFSSVPGGGHDGTFDGTSMATPHVAGIAAMIAQATGARGQSLWNELVRLAQSLSHPQMDVGAGLAKAPQLNPGLI